MHWPCLCGQATEADGSISFQYKVIGAADTLYFAFCFPKSYEEQQSQLDALEAAVPSNVYFSREVLTYSLDGRRLDLVTVSMCECTCGEGWEHSSASAPGLHGAAKNCRAATIGVTFATIRALRTPLPLPRQITSTTGMLPEREEFVPPLFPEGASMPRPHRCGEGGGQWEGMGGGGGSHGEEGEWAEPKISVML